MAITLSEWESFVDARSSGAIDARGRFVAEGQRQPVRARAVQADLLWLRSLLNWGTNWKEGRGRYLLRENPVRGYPVPKEKNVRRPVASTDRYEAVRAVTDKVMMERRWNNERVEVRSYLSELLDIAAGTGRRISAICGLRFDDLNLGEGPYGAIRWRRELDKGGRETTVPISPPVRAAIDRILEERPGIGSAPLFPSPADPTRPMSRHCADKLLRRAEKLAELEPQTGTLWHAYRRSWASSKKHLPIPDIARAGGWRSTEALRQCYVLADDAGVLAVVLDATEMREVDSRPRKTGSGQL
jgi:integrase